MNSSEGQKDKKANKESLKVSSWQEKGKLADKEEEVIRKDIDGLKSWVDMISTMNDEQLKGYLKDEENDDDDNLKTTRSETSKSKKRVQSSESGKSKISTSKGIMASVWKFHKE